STVRFIYDNWVVDGAPRTVKATMSIWAGKRWAEADVDLGTSFKPTIATGVIALKGAPLTKKDGYFYTFGVQSDPISDTKKSEALGLGVVFPKERSVGFVEEASTAGAIVPDDHTRVVLLSPDEKGHVTWGYMATWERGSLGIRDAHAMESECQGALTELTQ